jgi:integrase
LSLTQARREARKLVGDIARGGDPVADRRAERPDAANTVRSIAEEFFRREGGKLRSLEERRAVFDRVIFPKFGGRQIDSIKRSEIVRWLDGIEDERGPGSAQKAKAYLSKLMTWHAGRDDDFLTPFVRGMSRGKPGGNARDRTLSDDEIRAIWRATGDTPGPFGCYVRFLLLTATRRNEASHMSRAEREGDLWVIPASRMKGKAEHIIPLSTAAMQVLASIPPMGPWMFTFDGRRPIKGLNGCKKDLDERSGVTGWVLHDLRRTARSLMSRAGVDADIAERCLAHSIGGIRGVYDRHGFIEEKGRAFEALAAQLERIVNPQDNVISMRNSHVPA